MQPAFKVTLYESLEALPEGVTGEILSEQLHTQSRLFSSSVPGLKALTVRGSGAGGWWICPEPEVHFMRDTEVAVPNLAGWRRKRMPYLPEGHRFEVAPGSARSCPPLPGGSSTKRKGRETKMPLYAFYGVQYAWLIDPIEYGLEVYRLDVDTWVESGRFAGTDRVVAPPFEAVSLDLGVLWSPRGPALA